jgi:sterol desaturase/sphingolipid hydroxylase (fatty acid hydroxylase superfamily)
VAYELGPFRNHLSIGRIHHLHHVNWGKEGDCNFGLFLTLWDRLLGTFQPEPKRSIRAHDMGIDEVPDFPKSYLEQLAFPFVYRPGSARPYIVPMRRGAPMRGRHISPAE